MSRNKLRNNIDSILNSDNMRKFLWLKQNFAYCLMMSALVWFIGIGYYVDNYIGWANIYTANPLNFALFLIATFIPLLFLWFLLAYIERSSSLDANTKLFSFYVNGLMYPDEDTNKNVRALADILKKQTELLQKENKNVLDRSIQVKNDLDEKINNLTNILKLLDEYSGQTLIQLNDGVKVLADRCSYITDKTTHTVYNMQECSEDIKQNADNFLSKMNPILDEISAISSNIKNNIADNNSGLSQIKSNLTECANISQNHIDNLLDKTNENMNRIQQSFYKTAEECDTLYKKMDSSISSIEGRVEEQKRLIGKQTQVLDHNSDLLNNKLMKYGKDVSLEIDKLVKNSVTLEKATKQQLSSLKSVNKEAANTIQNIGGVFDEKRIEIQNRCDFAVSSIQNVIIAINKEIDKLTSFTSIAQAKNLDLQTIADTIVDKIGDTSNKLALKTDTLKDKAVEVIDKFNEAHDIICNGTDKINTSSEIIVNNGKEGVKLLEEQSFYINNAIANMDIIKEKLDTLKEDIKKSSEEVTSSLAHYENQINQVNNAKENKFGINAPESKLDGKKLLENSKTLNKILHRIKLDYESLFVGYDMFDLWDIYLEGNVTAFLDVLTFKMNKKQIMLIRKSFDDNSEFHNQVISYLFMMDLLIKDLLNTENRNELINFTVKNNLDKIYFILVKALNSAE